MKAYTLIFFVMLAHLLYATDKRETSSSDEYSPVSDAKHMRSDRPNRDIDVLNLDREVTGLVTDSAGNPFTGVSVSVKNSAKGTIGTTTDINGRYILLVPENAVLVFSMVGYTEQEISVSGRSTVNVVMIPAENDLGEVVVVAFGTQKKENVVGAVTTINPKDLKVPSSNLTTALAGRVSGMIAFQRSGEPGADNAQFFIRGATTFGYNRSPLILIDGVEVSTTDLARLQPDDVASFSILKDATSTALYGSRAANGVMIITTKDGHEGKARYFVRLENAMSSPTRSLKLADPVTYMKSANEAARARDPLAILPYSNRKIDNTVPGRSTYAYPATDWMGELFRSHTMNQRADVNISGGGNVSQYYVSGSVSQDNGMLKVPKVNNFNNNINLRTYSVRTNVTIKLSKYTTAIVRLSGRFEDYTGPLEGGTDIYNKVLHTDPVLFPPYFEPDSANRFAKHILFGNYGTGGYNNPYADMVKGYKNYSSSDINAQLNIKQDLSFITSGLSISAMLNTQRDAYFDVSRSYIPFWYSLGFYDDVTGSHILNRINPSGGTEYLNYTPGERTVSSAVYMQALANYSKTIADKHTLSSTLVYQMENRLTGQYASLQTSLPFRNLGLSGRATYTYDNRFNAEFNFGYNGSERFAANHRFGFFPSGGVSWNVSNEAFWDKIRPTVSNLKLRATYGLVGNDAIGSPEDRFFYLSEVAVDGAAGSTFGQYLSYARSGWRVDRYANPAITWEIAHMTDFGIEFSLWNKWTVEADYFRQNRSNILMSRASIPANVGLGTVLPRANVGEATNSGVDGSINYSEVINKDIWLKVRANFTYARSEYGKYEEPDYAAVNAPWLSRVNYPISQQWGYIAERLFIDDKDVASSPLQSFGEYGAGDIKYMDINRDGKITELDQVPIGFPTDPEIIYGFGISAGYKDFDFSCFFQGLSRESFWIDAAATSPFQGQTQLLQAYADDHWSERNQNIYALWPKFSPNVNANNVQQSTWWMRDGKFLRLKQIELGYSLPTRLMKKWRMNNVRVYLNATNLLTFTGFDLWDVEMAGNGLGYPTQKIANIGITTSF